MERPFTDHCPPDPNDDTFEVIASPEPTKAAEPSPAPLLARAIVVPAAPVRALPVSRGTLHVPGRRRAIGHDLGVPLLPLLLTIVLYAGMMAVSFGQGAYSIATEKSESELLDQDWLNIDADAADAETRKGLIREIVVVEGIDTLLVLMGLLIIARPPRGGPVGTWPFAWLLSGPGLAVVLSVNIGFAYLLRWLLTDGEPDDSISIGWTDGLVAWLLICAQPAIIEELFFRHLLYGHLRPHVGVHFAVLLSSIVFGMAHLGNPIAWPVLTFAGIFLGYARVYSGGLILPIILHFLHNFLVLLFNHLLFSA